MNDMHRIVHGQADGHHKVDYRHRVDGQVEQPHLTHKEEVNGHNNKDDERDGDGVDQENHADEDDASESLAKVAKQLLDYDNVRLPEDMPRAVYEEDLHAVAMVPRSAQLKVMLTYKLICTSLKKKTLDTKIRAQIGCTQAANHAQDTTRAINCRSLASLANHDTEQSHRALQCT
jgi:hypothetical protein